MQSIPLRTYIFFTIGFEKVNILNTYRELGIAVVAYRPLRRGFTTGQYKSIDDLRILARN
jgi:aryl-alcohol dehydrogenase-like predicted oxidoreductase